MENKLLEKISELHTDVAVIKTNLDSLCKKVDELSEYTHQQIHEQRNKLFQIDVLKKDIDFLKNEIEEDRNNISENRKQIKDIQITKSNRTWKIVSGILLMVIAATITEIFNLIK